MWGLSTIVCELVISQKLHYTLRIVLDLYILYKEGVSKTHQVGLDHRKVKPKIGGWHGKIFWIRWHKMLGVGYHFFWNELTNIFEGGVAKVFGGKLTNFFEMGTITSAVDTISLFQYYYSCIFQE